MSENLHSKVSGHWESVGWWGEQERGATLQCCHCGTAWIIQPGSGKTRGFCQRCMGFVCGPKCADCVPIEVRLENLEAGKPELAPPPVKVFVPTWAETKDAPGE